MGEKVSPVKGGEKEEEMRKVRGEGKRRLTLLSGISERGEMRVIDCYLHNPRTTVQMHTYL